MYFLTAEHGGAGHSLRGTLNRITEEHPLIWLANKRNERPDWGLTLLFWAEVSEGPAAENYRIEQEERGRMMQEWQAEEGNQPSSIRVEKTELRRKRPSLAGFVKRWRGRRK